MVEKIFFDNNLKMSLKILKEKFWENIRKTERTEVNYICKISSDEANHNAYLTDISLTGCKIISNEQLRKNSTYAIYIYRENRANDNYLKLYGNIKRVCANGTKLEYGFQFLNVTDRELEFIKYISSNSNNQYDAAINKLINEYQIS